MVGASTGTRKHEVKQTTKAEQHQSPYSPTAPSSGAQKGSFSDQGVCLSGISSTSGRTFVIPWDDDEDAAYWKDRWVSFPAPPHLPCRR
jgi:hypothetical protein